MLIEIDVPSSSECLSCSIQMTDGYGYHCSDCKMVICETCAQTHSVVCKPLSIPLSKAEAGDEAIIIDEEFDADSSTLVEACYSEDVCPSCHYPRQESAAESQLEYLVRNNKPMTKAEYDKVSGNLSGKQAHCVVPQTILRNEGRKFLSRYADQSPCDLKEEPLFGKLKTAYKAYMMDVCMQHKRPDDIEAHLKKSYRKRDTPEEVRRRVEALPPGGEEEKAGGALTIESVFEILGDRKNKDIKDFLSRKPRPDDVTVEILEPAKVFYLVAKKISGEDGNYTIVRRTFKVVNGKATKDINDWIDYDADNTEIERGDNESMKKIVEKTWDNQTFSNLMRSNLTVGNQCAYCEDVQGDFTLAERFIYFQDSKAPAEFVGKHLLEEIDKAKGLKQYMDKWLDNACDELKRTLGVACMNYPKEVASAASASTTTNSSQPGGVGGDTDEH